MKMTCLGRWESEPQAPVAIWIWLLWSCVRRQDFLAPLEGAVAPAVVQHAERESPSAPSATLTPSLAPWAFFCV